MAFSSTSPPPEGRAIRVRGRVQGVGLRPTVWRLARDCGLTGEVWNDAEGVMLRAWGCSNDLDRFLRRLEDEPPPLARIDAIEWVKFDGLPSDNDFRILRSRTGKVHTEIVPDAATCAACLAEVGNEHDRHWRYPFTNCTHCGPRLSILRAIPYDRSNTSMAEFDLCPNCRREYEDPADRRFHAQPAACPVCGPHVWLETFGFVGQEVGGVTGYDALIAARDLLLTGSIVAIKGLGGFHLACDACNDEAVGRLRASKRRYAKPFALMARDLEIIRQYCVLEPAEEALLKSSAAPIVILHTAATRRVAPAVSPRQPTLGFMLPYTPLHHLLLKGIGRPLVMTSGNRSEEPQCTGNEQARVKLGGLADYGLFHNRDILNRLDDSVARVVLSEPGVIRRGRGYAPAPITLPHGFERSPPLLALGGELKSTFCLVKDGKAILSQHLGDLEDAATFLEFTKAISLYRQLFDHEPKALAVDMHPEYLSTKLGKEMAAEYGCQIEEIQHHHAHIASCLAENAIPLNTRPVLGIALDGLGLGLDGAFWGGEFLLADYRGFERLAHFPNVAMAGGAMAIRQPWRSAFAHLEAGIGWERCKRQHPCLDFVSFLDGKPAGTLAAMILKGVNSPRSSSCGRLFDAVAALLGICADSVSYEGQAAIELEALVDPKAMGQEQGYPIAIRSDGCARGLPAMDFSPLWQAILRDLDNKTPASIVSARFHRGLSRAVTSMARLLFEREGKRLERTVALSGGGFQNKLLLENIANTLRDWGLTVLLHRQVPANDGGLALGQAAVAAARLIEHNMRRQER